MTDTSTRPKRRHQTARGGLRPLSDPEVVEDVEFLISLGRPNDEIARRCNVGLTAIEKKYGKRNPVE